MSTGTAGGAALIQDPEDVFELPAFYQGVLPLDRTRHKSSDPLVYDQRTAEVQGFRSLNSIDCEALIADALRSVPHAPDPASVLPVVDAHDMHTLTPLQAALVESVWGRGACSTSR